jgi:hypothetical protein
LEGKQLAAIHVISEEDWRKANVTSGGGGASASTDQLRAFTGMRWGSMF